MGCTQIRQFFGGGIGSGALFGAIDNSVNTDRPFARTDAMDISQGAYIMAFDGEFIALSAGTYDVHPAGEWDAVIVINGVDAYTMTVTATEQSDNPISVPFNRNDRVELWIKNVVSTARFPTIQVHFNQT